MIINILILALGIILAAAAVLLRKKLGTAWMISLLCGAVLVCVVGGAFTWASWKDTQEEKTRVYLALQYLEYQQTDSASFHLKKVDHDTFASTGAQALLEAMRSNTILVQLKLDALEGLAATNEQKGIVARLKNLTADDYDGQQSVAQLLRSQISLSEKQRKTADAQFVAESGYYIEGVDGEIQKLSEKELLRSEVNTSLNRGSFSGAVTSAAQLVELSASGSNRLLLAETIAEAVYNGEYLTGYEFLSDSDGASNAEKEREKLQKKIDKLTLETENLQLLIDGADGEEELAYTTQQSEILEQIKGLQKDQNYLFAKRALSSIADLHSLQAAIVRARLYYAMMDYEDAVECLLNAANSPAAWVNTDDSLRNAFNILKNTYNQSQTTGTQSVEFQEAMTTLISGGGSDLISIANSALTRSFVSYIMSAQKTYGKSLYSIGVDASNYPEMVVHLSGRDTVLEKLVTETDVIVRDTHHDVSYTVTVPESDNTFMNICCVVDESGSMSGEPTANLCSALSSFIAALGDNTSIGIVGFENAYTIHAPMSANHAAAEAAVSRIYASGGTNITAGIMGAMEAMEDCVGRRTVLLMTDGQSGIDMDVVRSAADAGYVIHTIGFGGVNDELLQQIADATGGQYIKAETSTELVNIYLSLVGMIGNEVEVHYTVTEQVTEDVNRYFFVRIPGEEVSLWLDYTLQQEVTAPEVYQVSPALVYEENANNGLEMTFTLCGENMQNVTEVTVGGKTAAITSACDTELTVQVPSGLSAGWPTIALTEADGTVTTVENMLCVAQELTTRTFLLKNLKIQGSHVALTEDGTLILSDSVTITDGAADQTQSTLSMTVNGLLAIPVDKYALLVQIPGGIVEPESSESTGEAAPPEETGQAEMPEVIYPEFPELSLRGDMCGAGYVWLNRDDSGYASDADNRVVQGSFTIVYTDDQVRLVQD